MNRQDRFERIQAKILARHRDAFARLGCTLGIHDFQETEEHYICGEKRPCYRWARCERCGYEYSKGHRGKGLEDGWDNGNEGNV